MILQIYWLVQERPLALLWFHWRGFIKKRMSAFKINEHTENCCVVECLALAVSESEAIALREPWNIDHGQEFNLPWPWWIFVRAIQSVATSSSSLYSLYSPFIFSFANACSFKSYSWFCFCHCHAQFMLDYKRPLVLLLTTLNLSPLFSIITWDSGNCVERRHVYRSYQLTQRMHWSCQQSV